MRTRILQIIISFLMLTQTLSAGEIHPISELEVCRICSKNMDLEQGGVVEVCTSSHYVHRNCLIKMLEKKEKKCPLCKKVLREDLLGELSLAEKQEIQEHQDARTPYSILRENANRRTPRCAFGVAVIVYCSWMAYVLINNENDDGS